MVRSIGQVGGVCSTSCSWSSGVSSSIQLPQGNQQGLRLCCCEYLLVGWWLFRFLSSYGWIAGQLMRLLSSSCKRRHTCGSVWGGGPKVLTLYLSNLGAEGLDFISIKFGVKHEYVHIRM